LIPFPAQAKPATPTETPPPLANTSSSQHDPLSSDPAALRSTPGSPSRTRNHLAAPPTPPVPAPAPAPVSTPCAPNQDASQNVSTACTDTLAAPIDVQPPQGAPLRTPVTSALVAASEYSADPPTSDHIPAPAPKKTTRPRAAKKDALTSQDPKPPAPARGTHKTAAKPAKEMTTKPAKEKAVKTTTKPAKEKAAKTTRKPRKAPAPKEVCPGR